MRLYDTYSRSLVELPSPPGPVRMYFCGPTVYARAHVGNARPFIIGMWLRSWLRESGLRGGARPQHHRRQRQDLRRGAGRERRARRARDRVVSRRHRRPRPRHARPPAEGDRVDPGDRRVHRGARRPRLRLPGAGRRLLPGRALPRVRPALRPAPRPGRGAGAEPAEGGRRDFALWKANKPGTEDTWWESPWGRGRPGWHIECSAMAEEVFGPAFEIHGGGLDLVFPHHENEVAQSRALGHPFAQIWAHNGMLRFTGEKMSKSLGNVATLRDALDEWGRETLLLFFLGAHWRKPVDYSDDTLAQAAARLETLRNAFTLAPAAPQEDLWAGVRGGARRRFRHAAGAGRAPRMGFDRPIGPAGARFDAVRPRLARGARPGAARGRCARRAARKGAPATGILRPPTGCATSWRRSAGRCATSRAAAMCSSAVPRDERLRLRAPGRPRGAARPPRGARGLGDRPGAEVRGVARRGAARR